MSGARLTFSEADLNATATAYDPARHEAPIVVGHPASDGPAYGWVKGLTFSDAGLKADPDQIDPAFAEMVAAGRFKKVSASFYEPDSPANPVPGVYYLRHVGFLGATPPAVKGLKAVGFSEDDAGVVTLDFGDFGELDAFDVSRLFRSLREWFIGKHGLEAADQALPGWNVDSLQIDAAKTDAAATDAADEVKPNPAFVEAPQPEKEPTDMTEKDKEAAAFAEREEKLASNEKKLAADQADFAEKARRTDAAAFIDGLIEDGKVLPAEKEQLTAFMASLDPESIVQFGEKDDDKKSPLDIFKANLEAQPKRVDFAERSAAGKDDDSLDEGDPLKVADAAIAFQEQQRVAGITVSADVAVRHILNEKE